MATATRGLGFRLSVVDAQQTVQQLAKINAALDATKKKIKEVRGSKLTLSTSFDKAAIDQLLKVLDKVKSTKLSPEIVGQIKELKKELELLKKQYAEAQATISKLQGPSVSDADIVKADRSLKAMNGTAVDAVKNITSLRANMQDIGTEDVEALYKALVQVEGSLKEIRKTKIRVEADKGLTQDQKNSQLAELKQQEAELIAQRKIYNKEVELTTKRYIQEANNIPTDSINGMRLRLEELTRAWNNLSIEAKEGIQGQKLKAEIASILGPLNQGEQEIGNFKRNVGNYRDAITGILPVLENLQREGKVAATDLIQIFKAQSAADINRIEKEIADLVAEYRLLGDAMEKAGDRAVVLDKIEQKTRELHSASANIKNTTNNFQALQGKLLSVGDVLSGGLIGGGVVATLGFIKSFGSAAFQEFKEIETATSKINQQLAVTGNRAGKSAAGLQDMALELEKLTGFESDRVLGEITSTLLRFGSVQGEVFDRAQKATIDLAATMDGDLRNAAVQIGRALEDPANATGRLSRAGIVLSKETKKAIDNALKANDAYKAQNIILNALEDNFKGVSDAIQNSKLGAIRQFSVDMQNLKESIGSILVSVFNTATTAIRDFGDGVLFAADGTKETERATKKLNAEFAREKVVIDAAFASLKNDNISREEKKILIDNLVAKYPSLLKAQDLEGKSLIELEGLQTKLTNTVKKQTFERIVSMAKESAEAALYSEEIRLAFLRARDIENLGFFDRSGITSTISLGGNADKIFDAAIKASETKRDKLRKQTEDIEKNVRASLEKSFGAIDEVNVLATKTVISGVNAAGEQSDEALKALEDRIAQVRELQRKIKDLQIEADPFEFTKSLETIKENTKRQIEDIQAELNKLELQEIKTPKDAEIIRKSKELIQEIRKAEQRAIDEANFKRQQSLNEAVKELQQTKSEVDQILKEVGQTDIDIQIGEIEFNIEQAVANIEREFTARKSELDNLLTSGLISQKDYDKKSLELERDKFAQVNGIYSGAREEYFRFLDDKLKADLAYSKSSADLERQSAKNDLDAEIVQINQDFLSGKIKTDQDRITAGIAAYQKFTARIKKIAVDSQADEQKIRQEDANNREDFNQTMVTSWQSAQLVMTKIAAAESKKRRKLTEEEQKELLKQLRDGAIELAQEVSDALFEIENNKAEANYEKQQDNLEKQYANKIELAKGNSAEIERLERERDVKLKQLEKTAADRRKKQAISQAIINGALAVGRALASVDFPFNLVAATIVAAATALQVIKIRSQSFAKGAYFNSKGRGGYTGGSQAPPDETGQRPIGTGVLHVDEYIATARQTRGNPWLFDILDKDRQRTNAGASSRLEDELFTRLMERRKAIYSLQDPTVKMKPVVVIPFINPRYAGSGELKLSDDQMYQLAQIIADQVGTATERGTAIGSAQGTMKGAAHQARLLSTKQRAAV